MPNDDEMSINERRKYLKLVAPGYRKSNRAERSRLLTEMVMVTGLHRKSLTRLIGMSSLERTPRKPVWRRRRYSSPVTDAVHVVRKSLDCVCRASDAGASGYGSPTG